MSLRTYENIIKSYDFYLPSCIRKTKNIIRKKIRESKKPVCLKEDLIDDLEILKTKRIYKSKTGFFGDTVELDACVHPFNDQKYYLYHAVDRFSGMVLATIVEKEETSIGYLKLLRKLFSKWGKPRLIITDKRKSFWNGIDNSSQISLILKKLDIEIITSSDPTSKPNVERSFHNAQQLYPLICFKESINTFEKLQKNVDKLTKIYNFKYNKKSSQNSSFKAVNNYEIERYLNLTIVRRVLNTNTFQINGVHYVPIENNKRIILPEGVKITIFGNEFCSLFIKSSDKKIKLEILNPSMVNPIFEQQRKRLELEKRKSISFNKTLDKKIALLRAWENKLKKAAWILEKQGINFEKLHV